MATKLKVVEDVADIVPAPTIPQFEPAPTRKRKAGWTADSLGSSSKAGRPARSNLTK